MKVNKRRIRKLTKNDFINVDQLNAYKVAYGNPLDARDYTKYIGLPAICFGLLATVLLYTWWISLLSVVIGAFYGAKVFMPLTLKNRYEHSAFVERNKFVNNMTQRMTDDQVTVKVALKSATNLAKGDLHEDLMKFRARIEDANNIEKQKACQWLINQYKKDIVFELYIDQIETALIEGKQNIEAFKDTTGYHELVKKKKAIFEQKKAFFLKGMKKVVVVMFFFLLILNNFMGFQEYITHFTKHPIGIGASVICLVWMGINTRDFFNRYFDDEVMEVPMK